MPNEPDSSQEAWPPGYLDVSGVAYLLSTSQRQVQRLLASGRLPLPDLNVSGTGGPRGRRWNRQRLLEWLDARRL